MQELLHFFLSSIYVNFTCALFDGLEEGMIHISSMDNMSTMAKQDIGEFEEGNDHAEKVE